MAPGIWTRRLGTVARLASGELIKRVTAAQSRQSAGSDRTSTRTPTPTRRPAPTPRESDTARAPSRPTPRAAPRATPPGVVRAPYPGDFAGEPPWEYAPKSDGQPDPGEVVWAWVPYEEDHQQGKDRPAIVIGRDGPWLLAMPLTSKDHDRDAAQEASVGRHWVDVGAGAWDKSGRPSEARVDRVVRLEPTGVRREGAALSREVFDLVVEARQRAYDSGDGS